MPISTDPRLIDVPPWRRVSFSIWARLKHWVGVHTYIKTMRPSFDEQGVLTLFTIRHECWICEKLR